MILELILAAAALAPQDTGAFEKPTVRFELDSGEEWWTVRARNASPLRVVGRVAELSGRSIEGHELLERAPLVTVDLERRPIDTVLQFVLGSVGLRHELRRDAITVLLDDPDGDDLELRLGLAAAAWLRATTLFPEHPRASTARLMQGELAELRGLEQVARNYYVSLIEDHPEAPEVGEAYMRAGRLSLRMGLYSEAADYFRALATTEGSSYRAAARLQLARAMIELGDPQYALHVLRNLEEDYPPVDITERTARSLVRAHAQNARSNPIEALRELDGLDRELDPIGSWEALAIRARSLEAMSLKGEAARAWLAYSRDARGEEQELALEQAVRLSLDDDDELGALFICREARRLGLDGFDSYQREARRRLGFAVAGDAEGAGVVERIEQGEELLARGEVGAASPIFEHLFLARTALTESEAARVSAGWATCVAERRGVEIAIALLSEERRRFQGVEAKKRLDVVAARLFEAAELYERAVEAYQGSY